jgi:COP9 signalosome complex subunit 3
MSSELLAILFQFQPDAPEFQVNRFYDAAARMFVRQVANIDQQHFLKGADTSEDLLDVLNPTVNTISYIFALRHRVSALAENPKAQKSIPEQLRPGGALWNKIVLFFETADPVQLRYVGTEWKKLVEYVEMLARAIGTVSRCHDEYTTNCSYCPSLA